MSFLSALIFPFLVTYIYLSMRFQEPATLSGYVEPYQIHTLDFENEGLSKLGAL